MSDSNKIFCNGCPLYIKIIGGVSALTLVGSSSYYLVNRYFKNKNSKVLDLSNNNTSDNEISENNTLDDEISENNTLNDEISENNTSDDESNECTC